MKKSDCKMISAAFVAQGWNKSERIYREYFTEQQFGDRDVFIAEYEGEFAGYVTIKWETEYDYFRENNIPEIKDLNTLIKFRNKGIATHLMDVAEARIKEKDYSIAGIGVGLYSDYGIAQKMYIDRGYNFDTRGLMYNGEQVPPGTQTIADDNLTLFLLKKVRRET
ncbi:MAG: GNAT family N-acetyltransferase [Candidatus Cloacimonetes bacterium]|nr:GNAT family N-acetyltransferase [Candidatus Cloacimonadota bacterium]